MVEVVSVEVGVVGVEVGVVGVVISCWELVSLVS
jgi:hypothetical protein